MSSSTSDRKGNKRKYFLHFLGHLNFENFPSIPWIKLILSHWSIKKLSIEAKWLAQAAEYATIQRVHENFIYHSLTKMQLCSAKIYLSKVQITAGNTSPSLLLWIHVLAAHRTRAVILQWGKEKTHGWERETEQRSLTLTLTLAFSPNL